MKKRKSTLFLSHGSWPIANPEPLPPLTSSLPMAKKRSLRTT
jgi:hypothetical protein